MVNKVERIISSRNLKPKKKEGFLKIISVFSFLGIMLGVSILIIVMSVMNGFRTDLTNKILGLNPHIIINSNGNYIDDNYQSLISKKYNDFNLTKSFNGEGIAITNEITKGVLVKGIQKDQKEAFNFIREKIIKGEFEKLDKNSILIGSELAYNLNLEVGDMLTLMTSSFMNTPLGSVPKQQSYSVAGIFNSGFIEYDKNVVLLELNEILSLFNKTKKNLNIEIYLKEPLKADLYKKELKKISDKFYIYSWTDLNKSFFSALKVERNVMFVILTMIIIVATFNIISGLTILIKNKTREIAILKTLGLSNTSIKKIFFLTGMSIGFFSTISGVLIGTIFSIYIEEIRIFISNIFSLEIFPPEVYFLEEMPSEVSFKSVMIISFFSLLISAIASYIPSRSISQMNITKALKYE